MARFSCTRLPAVGIAIVVGIAMCMQGIASMRMRLSPQEAAEAEEDAQDKDSDTCFTSGKCIRLMLPAGQAPTHDSSNDMVTLPVYMCARAGKPLNQRFAYAAGMQSLRFTKENARWETSFESQTYYIKHIFAVASSADEIEGAHVVKDSHRPPLNDEEMTQRDEMNTDTKSRWGWWTSTSSSQKIGQMSGDRLANSLSREQADEAQVGGDVVRFVVDLKTSGSLKCPALDATGNHAYSSADNFKLMVFGSGRTCRSLAADSPPKTERYCIPFPGLNVRGWAVPIDLQQAAPVVRNPALERNGGKTFTKDGHPHLPVGVSNRALSEVVAREKKSGDVWCRYLMYSPEQWMSQARRDLLPEAQVVINTNFYRFLDVRDLPCGTPLGPVVADGVAVQTYRGTAVDHKVSKAHPDNVVFDKVKAADVLVMHSDIGAFTMKAHSFDAWFDDLQFDERAKVNVVTGHKVLQDGQPVNGLSDFEATGDGAFWSGSNARTAVGIQYSGMCASPGPARTKCGKMLLLLQFEQSKPYDTREVKTFYGNATMHQNDRPDSDGVTIPEMQTLLQFLMVDDAINFDGSGSSGLWTSIGDLAEKRSQPSDILQDGRDLKYQFRPSPIHMAFKQKDAQ